MIKNDVLRRIRYILDLEDSKMIELFANGGLVVSRAEISDWMKKDDDPAYKECSDAQLATFLNGLIIDKRGRKEGEQPIAEKTLSNNQIFRKLMIAFSLRSEDVIEILNLANLRVGKPELSAFFRKPEHKNYRECKAQILRNFLNGLQSKLTSSGE